MTDPIDAAALLERYRVMQERVAQAARDSDRSPEEIVTVVVTKNHPVELAAALAQAGVLDLGENRHQEAEPKASLLAGLAEEHRPRWHFVGQLQSNKARAVRRYASAVHSVDRPSLIGPLAAPLQPSGVSGAERASGVDVLDVFLQVDLDQGPSAGRGGALPAMIVPLAERILSEPTLRLRGLMAVAPLGENPDAAFARLAALRERLLTIAPAATALSAGMSGDFAAAIRHGATHLRIGTAITGKRASPA